MREHRVTFEIRRRRDCDKKAGKDEQSLSEDTGRREMLAHIAVKIGGQQAIGVRDRFNIVPCILRQAVDHRGRTMGVNAAPLA